MKALARPVVLAPEISGRRLRGPGATSSTMQHRGRVHPTAGAAAAPTCHAAELRWKR